MNTPTILLIEDSPADAELIVAALAPVVPAKDIKVCADGVEALDFLHCRGEHLGHDTTKLLLLVLLDLNLSRMPSLEVLRAIRGDPATRLLPVTVFSASDSQEDICMAAGLRANSYVRKSADVRQMADDIFQLARYWLELNIPPPSRAGQ